MDDNNKYNCDRCNFKSETKLRWEAHIKTELHLTGQRKKRSDYKEPFKCNDCEYETKNVTMLKIHKLNKHSTKEERKEGFPHYCKNCNYGSFTKSSYDLHILTSKHKHFETLS